jgi:hypothetical protein
MLRCVRSWNHALYLLLIMYQELLHHHPGTTWEGHFSSWVKRWVGVHCKGRMREKMDDVSLYVMSFFGRGRSDYLLRKV